MLSAWLWSLIPTFVLAARFAWKNWELIADWGYWAVIVPLRWFGLATRVRLPALTQCDKDGFLVIDRAALEALT